MSNDILMPKATASWLIQNTTLTFEQIANFCKLHLYEVQMIADEHIDISPIDPILIGQLSQNEIDRCASNANFALIAKKNSNIKSNKKIKKYVPISKRNIKPGAIYWIIKNYPQLNDNQICTLIGTTKSSVSKVKESMENKLINIEQKHPVHTGLCTEQELNNAIKDSVIETI